MSLDNTVAVIEPAVTEQISMRQLAVVVFDGFSFPSGDPTEFEGFGQEEYGRLAFLQRFMDEYSGFNKIQSTRPETLGHALADSPAGQLAWVLDLLRGFGDHPAEVDKMLDADFVLTIASLYWLTNTSASCARLYYENAHQSAEPATRGTIPTVAGTTPGRTRPTCSPKTCVPSTRSHR
jgi:epoxide hydrolase